MEIVGLNLSVVGIGRLGLCFALNLEKAGYNVIGYDIRDDHIYEVNRKLFRSSEPGLNDLVKNYKNFRATSSLTETVSESDIIFVTLRTESDMDGKYNHDQIESFLEQLQLLGKQDKPKHLVICSNVQPGYTNTVAERVSDLNYIVSFNPETIAQGQIVEDQVYPSIIIIGEANEEAGDLICGIYDQMCLSEYTVHRMDRTSAELTKVGLNCSLTAKISMANTIGDVAIRLGGDPSKILSAIGSDDRIGNKYFKHGYGYGGPCFPRDNRAFIRCASEMGITAHMNIACDKTNEDHLTYQLDDFCSKHDVNDPVIITDVTFKPDCPIIEESQQLEFAVGLANRGYSVTIRECEEVISQVKLIHKEKFNYENIEDIFLLKK